MTKLHPEDKWLPNTTTNITSIQTLINTLDSRIDALENLFNNINSLNSELKLNIKDLKSLIHYVAKIKSA